MGASLAFAGWQENVQEKQRRNRAARKVMQRWQNLALSVPYETWHYRVTDAKRLSHAARKIICKWRRLRLVVPFESWHLNIFEHRRLYKVAGVVLVRWYKMRLSSSWTTWLQHCELRKRYKHMGLVTVKRLLNRTLSAGFSRWCDFTAEVSVLRTKVESVLARWINQEASRSFNMWRDHTTRQWQESHWESRMRKRLLNSSLAKWNAHLREHRRLRQLTMRVWRIGAVRCSRRTFIRWEYCTDRRIQLGLKQGMLVRRLIQLSRSNYFKRWRNQVVERYRQLQLNRKAQICAMFPAVAEACYSGHQSTAPCAMVTTSTMTSTGTQCASFASSPSNAALGRKNVQGDDKMRETPFFTNMQERFEKEREMCQSLDAAFSLSLAAHLR